MKISEKMFGLPGKCVACRQKIRVPRLDELAEGVTEIYLKEHPEFLRTPPKPRPKAGAPPSDGAHSEESAEEARSAVAVAAEPDDDLALGRDSERVSTIPFEVLEPHRVLCCLQRKAERKAASLNAEESSARADLEQQMAVIRQARADLDEQLRQMLMETAIELANTQEKIVQEGISARVGEIAFEAYQESMDRLRRRRDKLERRQHNLRGWLVTTDPHLAGGYEDLPMDRVPQTAGRVPIPSEADETDALINVYTTALRKALHARAQAERKLAEMDKLEAAGDTDRAGVKDAKAAYKGEKTVAEAEVQFWRDRLQQLRRDYNGDLDTYSAMLDVAQSRLQVGDVDRNRFEQLETMLVRAKNDAIKAQAVANRALNANSAQDVPIPKGTFIGRLGLGGGAEIGTDSWLAWITALAFGLSIFAPAVGDFSLAAAFLEFAGSESAFRWAFAGPVAFGIAVALLGALPDRVLRGRLLAGTWLLATIVGALVIQEAHFSLDTMATRFRVGMYWPVRPGMIMLLAGHVLLLGAVAASWLPQERERRWFPGLAVAGVLAAVVIFTNGFGVVVPKPAIAVREAEGGAGSRVIAISNAGYRSANLMARPSDAQSSYLLVLEKAIGTASAEDITEETLSAVMTESPRGVLEHLEPGETVELHVPLEPGEYRLRLECRARGDEVVANISVPESAGGGRAAPQGDPAQRGSPPAQSQPGETGPDAPEDAADAPAPAGETARGEAPSEEAPAPEPEPSSPERSTSGVEVQFVGIMWDPEDRPAFTFVLHYPDGTREQVSNVPLQSEVAVGWTVVEYNQQLKTVTLQNEDEDIVIVKKDGSRVEL